MDTHNEMSTLSDHAHLRVTVDNGACQIYGICQQEAPEVFDVGIDGRLRYRSHPDLKHTEHVYQAARCCPTQAIAVSGDDR